MSSGAVIMTLVGVDGVVLGVEDVSDAGRFYDDFGLGRLETGGSGLQFGTLDGTTIDLRSTGDNGLPPAVVEGPTIREVIWGAADSEAVQKVAAELEKDRSVRRGHDGTIHSLDDDGYGIAFRTARRTPVEPAPNRLNIYGAPPSRPINSRIDFYEAIRPAAIAHVVLFSPDVERASRFYVERLGFRVSDRFIGGQGAFLRSAGSPYHHNLFIIRGQSRGLHHIAFAVTDFNDVVLGGKELLKKGWEPKMGPGRHVIGSNYFWYFKSPCGGAMELTADMDRADDDWVAGDWEFVPQNTMAWVLDNKALPGSGPEIPDNVRAFR
jgi:catechol 2,3-dioxygenase-like lactoylglutathione lyase family enzyme